MVLSVLFYAGAVPLSVDDHYHPTTSAAGHYSSTSPANPEYVHYLEELVGELSGVFATFIHQNPPPSSPTSLTDMYHQRANTCRSSPSGLLPDVIPKHGTSDKWSCSSPSSEDLRMRRGMAPMRFRLDSVGSSVPSATSSAVSTPTSATSFFSSAATSPMAFDLLPSPTTTSSTTSSTVSFFADYPPLSSDISEHRTDLDASLPIDATDAADVSAADWRQVGRDLRGIADHFASTRRSQNSATGCQQWSLLSSVLSSSSFTSAGPLVSALAVYLWWKLVRRLTA